MAGKYDKMSFGKAFAAARKDYGGDGGKFPWRGKSYSTNIKKKTAAPAKSLRPKARPGLPKDEKIKVTELPAIGSTSTDTIKNRTNKAITKAAKKPKMFASSSTSAKPVKKTSVKKTSVKKTSVKKTPVKKTPVKKASVKKTPVKKASVKKGILAYDYREWNALSKSEREKRDLPLVLVGGLIQYKTKQQIARNQINKNKKTSKTTNNFNTSQTKSRAGKARQFAVNKDLKQTER